MTQNDGAIPISFATAPGVGAAGPLVGASDGEWRAFLRRLAAFGIETGRPASPHDAAGGEPPPA